MVIAYGAGHVAGPKIWKGYNEDESMIDLARRKSNYTQSRYGIESHVMYVTELASYPLIEKFCRDRNATICSLEHSNAAPTTIDNFETINRVTIFRTVKNPGDGPCTAIGEACAKILNTTLKPIQHRTNSSGDDWYGAIRRAMRGGCEDAWLTEHGFHTHPATRELLLKPEIRQRIAEAEVDAMAKYYGWKSDSVIKVTSPLTKSDAVYDYQKLVKGMGYNIGAYTDMKTGQPTGCDGLYGATMETITNELRKKYGLAQTGIVDADLYGKIALELASKPDDSAKVEALETRIKALQAEVNAKSAIAFEASNKLKSARNAIDTLNLL